MMKRYMEGELAPDAPKKANDPMEFSGGYSGPKLGPDVEGKAKKVTPFLEDLLQGLMKN